ncbi:MAG: uroporphyrinogen decarboxylase [Clostridiales Family XIII bacterium]|nr:uroporphyrinogen decarboxylase [Clostridiales Family XIII bacterium]
MDEKTLALFDERDRNRSDLLALKTPKRVPVFTLFTLEAAVGLTDSRLLDCHYDLPLAEKAHMKICETFYSDSLPSVNLRYPPVYDILGSKNWLLGSNGAVQYSGFEFMDAEEYGEFTASPYKTILEKYVPRVCSELGGDPIANSITLAKAFSEYKRQLADHTAIYVRMIERFGYASGTIAGPTTVAPFDFIGDQLRGMNGVMGDIFRCPDKVEAAVNALVPYMVRLAAPGEAKDGRYCFIPLHFAPYLNQKSFDRLYWPSLKQVVLDAEKLGVRSSMFIENNWTRYLDYLETLPSSVIGWVDDGDPAAFTEKFGKNHVFGGFYDPMITLTRSKEDCIDEAKRLCDTCMKSGHFYFTFNKSIMDIKSIDIGKLQAVLEWVRDEAYY